MRQGEDEMMFSETGGFKNEFAKSEPLGKSRHVESDSFQEVKSPL